MARSHKKPNPYKPLIWFGLAAVSMWLIYYGLETVMCSITEQASTDTSCALPKFIVSIPLVFILIGALMTAWNLHVDNKWQ